MGNNNSNNYTLTIEGVHTKPVRIPKHVRHVELINCSCIIEGYYTKTLNLHDCCNVDIRIKNIHTLMAERSSARFNNAVHLNFEHSSVIIRDTNTVIYNPDYPCDISQGRNVRIYNVDFDTDFSFIKKCQKNAIITVFTKTPLIIDPMITPPNSTIKIKYY